MIELQRDGDLFTLSLGEDENRFTLDSLTALERRLDEVLEQAGDGPAGLIVTAGGKIWSNGIDLQALSSAPPADQAAFLPALNRVLARMLTFPMPTVAALNGHCFAGGAVLAMTCDYRVMRTGRGWFCLPEIDIGVPFTAAMMTLLRAKLRPETLRDAVLSGRRYTAQEALAAGIVDGCGEPERLGALAQETITQLTPKGRAAFTRFKQDLYGELARAFA